MLDIKYSWGWRLLCFVFTLVVFRSKKFSQIPVGCRKELRINPSCEVRTSCLVCPSSAKIENLSRFVCELCVFQPCPPRFFPPFFTTRQEAFRTLMATEVKKLCERIWIHGDHRWCKRHECSGKKACNAIFFFLFSDRCLSRLQTIPVLAIKRLSKVEAKEDNNHVWNYRFAPGRRQILGEF